MYKYSVGQRVYLVYDLRILTGKILSTEYSFEDATVYAVSFDSRKNLFYESELFETREDCKPSFLKSLQKRKEDLEKRLEEVNKVIDKACE